MKTQMWIAICVYVLVAIVRKELGMKQSGRNLANSERVAFRENPYF